MPYHLTPHTRRQAILERVKKHLLRKLRCRGMIFITLAPRLLPQSGIWYRVCKIERVSSLKTVLGNALSEMVMHRILKKPPLTFWSTFLHNLDT